MTTALPPTITDADVTLREVGAIPGISAGQYFGYCTVAGVAYEFANLAEMPQITGSPTATTKSRIAQEIFGAAVELQAELDHYYVMPYTGSSPNILAQLFDLNAKLAAARILKRLFANQETAQSAGVAELDAWVSEFYHAISAGKVRWDDPFGDATPRVMLQVYDLASGLAGFPSEASGDASKEPLFRLGQPTRFQRGRMM